MQKEANSMQTHVNQEVSVLEQFKIRMLRIKSLKKSRETSTNLKYISYDITDYKKST